MPATAMPWFDLTSWSAWASIAGLIVSVVGLGLSVWVLRRTGAIQAAVRKARIDTFHRGHLLNLIGKVDITRSDIRILLKDSSMDTVDAREQLASLPALARQIKQVVEENDAITQLLNQIVQKRRAQGHQDERQRLTDLFEDLTELSVELDDYQSRVAILGGRS